MFRSSNFDKLLDHATTNLRLDTDWPTILQICDLIRQNDCTPKYAVAAIKKKLYLQNPHKAMFALLVLESIVKNCGSGVHDEIASKPNCEMLRELVKTTQHENLRSKTLELIQAWAFAFRNTPKYRAVQDTMNIMKAEGYKFPPLKESDAMFSADTAPDWSDGDVCNRCRTAFSLMVRKHHCRACGQVFCQQCSAKTSTIPKFGIEKEVRVCDACFDKVSRPPSAGAVASKPDSVDTASDYGPAAQQPQKRAGGGKTAEELQEEEELQLALALSQSEADHKEKERKRPVSGSAPSLHQNVSPSPSSVSASPEHGGASESELSRYLDRGYWEQRRDTAPPASAPAEHSTHPVNSEPSDKVLAASSAFIKSGAGLENCTAAGDIELEGFVAALKSQIEIFVNRMKSDSSRGRSIANDTSVQTLFMNITAMHSRLLRYIQLQDDGRVHYESLQDKVSQTRDSRAALDTLRAEHSARLAAAAEAAERQRQLQMAHKLHTMRKKKHEYLQYQRQLALQRVQEQEREMQMRQEQQKQQYLMSGSGYYIQGAPVPYQHQQHPFHNQPVFPNPQYHQAMHADQQAPGQQPLLQQINQQPMSQHMAAMTRAGNPSLPPMMMQQLRMGLPVHGMPGGVPSGHLGQPAAPPQSPAPQNPQQLVQKQGQNIPGAPVQPGLNSQMQLGQTMGQQIPGGVMNVHGHMSEIRASGIQSGQQMPIQQQMRPQGQPMPQVNHRTPHLGPQGQVPIQNQMPQAPPVQGQSQMVQQQQMPQGQQMHPQGQHIPPQEQQMPLHGQQMPPHGQQMPPLGQPMPQGQHMPPQGQQMPPQGQHMPQGPPIQGQQSMGQGQQIPPQDPQVQPSSRQPGPPQAVQSAPAPASVSSHPKMENPTAELISFD